MKNSPFFIFLMSMIAVGVAFSVLVLLSPFPFAVS